MERLLDGLGTIGSSPRRPANPTTRRPPAISVCATTAEIVAGQPADWNPAGTPRATASTFVDAPGFPSAAILAFLRRERWIERDVR